MSLLLILIFAHSTYRSKMWRNIYHKLQWKRSQKFLKFCASHGHIWVVAYRESLPWTSCYASLQQITENAHTKTQHETWRRETEWRESAAGARNEGMRTSVALRLPWKSPENRVSTGAPARFREWDFVNDIFGQSRSPSTLRLSSVIAAD